MNQNYLYYYYYTLPIVRLFSTLFSISTFSFSISRCGFHCCWWLPFNMYECVNNSNVKYWFLFFPIERVCGTIMQVEHDIASCFLLALQKKKKRKTLMHTKKWKMLHKIIRNLVFFLSPVPQEWNPQCRNCYDRKTAWIRLPSPRIRTCPEKKKKKIIFNFFYIFKKFQKFYILWALWQENGWLLAIAWKRSLFTFRVIATLSFIRRSLLSTRMFWMVAHDAIWNSNVINLKHPSISHKGNAKKEFPFSFFFLAWMLIDEQHALHWEPF